MVADPGDRWGFVERPQHFTAGFDPESAAQGCLVIKGERIAEAPPQVSRFALPHESAYAIPLFFAKRPADDVQAAITEWNLAGLGCKDPVLFFGKGFHLHDADRAPKPHRRTRDFFTGA
jgi:hypothetical protein